jgi:hypothetical protein
MSLRFVSPPNPAQKWFEFVGRTSAILTGTKGATIAMEAKSCVDMARSHYFEARIYADTDETDTRVELLIGER